MKYILIMIFLAGCSLLTEQVIEDVIEGEASVAEKVVEDILGPQPNKFPIKKF